MTVGLSETTEVLAGTSIAGPILAGWLGWWLGRRFSVKDKQQDRDAERANSAFVLLSELAKVKKELEARVPSFITLANYTQDFPYLPTSTYEELRQVGRVTNLGPDVSEKVNALYALVRRSNEIFTFVNGHPNRYQREEVMLRYGEKWSDLVRYKGEFLGDLPAVGQLLEKLVAPKK